MLLPNEIKMFINYLKTTWRHFQKNKLHSTVNLLGLSVGITCCIVLFIFTRYESCFDNYHPFVNRTYRIVQHTQMPEQMLYWNTTAYPLAQALREDFNEFEMVTQISGPTRRTFSIDRNDQEVLFEESGVLFVDQNFKDVFAITWLAGNSNTAFDQPNSIVLTHSLAENYFPGVDLESILGQTINLASKDPLIVMGIIKDPPGNTNFQFSLLIPYAFFKMHNSYFATNWSGNYQGTTFGVLKANFSPKDIGFKINNWKKKYLNEVDDARISYYLQPLNEIHNETLYGASPGGYILPKKALQLSRFVGFFILLIGLINFVNLVTAQASQRGKEIGIRKVVGSNRSGLFVQFAVENALIVIFTVGLSVLFSDFILQQLNAFLSIIDLQLTITTAEIGSIGMIACVSLILATIYPAFVLSGYRPVAAIQHYKLVKGKSNFLIRKLLMTFQFTLVQIFVIASLIIAIQMHFMESKALGFDMDGIVMTPIPDFDKADVFKSALLKEKAIMQVAIGSGPPMSINDFALGTTFRLPQESLEAAEETEMKIADLDYIDLYNLELVAGRNFTDIKQGFDQFIVNEKLISAKGWTAEEAIGKRLVINEGEATIVGVVKNFHNHSLQNEITPCVLVNWTYFQDNAFIKMVQINKRSLKRVEAAWKSVFTGSVFNLDFLDNAMEREYLLEKLIMKGFSILSILAILIGSLGLFALMTFLTHQKRKEVGIRKVLGASVMQIVATFSREFLILLFLSFLVAVPIVYYFAQKGLQNFAYRIDLSIWMFVAGGMITLIIAISTSSFQSIKAALANPVKSLKSE